MLDNANTSRFRPTHSPPLPTMAYSRDLAARFEAYGDWRRRLSGRISGLHDWLQQQDLADAQVDIKVQQLLERLHQDKLIVAFVAEFSRGKSELINAIFFADFGQRLLPSSAGRTTMCPTELLYDASRPPSIRLLPIETRLKDATVSEFKNYADEWVTFPLDLGNAEKMGEVLGRVSQVKRVPVDLARKYGLFGEGEEDMLAALEDDDECTIDIPCWRHAVINFPHPLLQQGLVILDTPGLNAIGTEPELTLNLLPNAHAVLFILAADAGVTKTDLEVWNQHLAGDDPATRAGRLVILNKIDGLWDDLKSEAEINAEINRQMRNTAQMLGVPGSQVFAASAQKALLAKVNGDDALLARSRLPALEHSLSQKLIPAKRDIVGAASQSELRALAAGVRSILDARVAGIEEQLAELTALRGKNQDVVGHMMQRVREEKELFERGLARYTALRNVFTQQTNELFDHIGLEALRANAGRTRRSIEDSPFTKGVRGAMSEFFRRYPQRPRRGGAPGRGDPRHDARDVYALRQGTRPRAIQPAAVLGAQVSEGDRTARTRVQHALQHAVEHGQQGQVRLDEALLRDDRVARQARLRHRQSRRRGLAQGGHVAVGNAGQGTPPAVAPAPRKH